MSAVRVRHRPPWLPVTHASGTRRYFLACHGVELTYHGVDAVERRSLRDVRHDERTVLHATAVRPSAAMITALVDRARIRLVECRIGYRMTGQYNTGQYGTNTIGGRCGRRQSHPT